jgi:hypothetical protein
MIIKNRDWLSRNIKTIISALVIDCPYGENPALCPFHGIRQKEDADKFEWVENLSDDEMIGYYDYHEKCFRDRQA